MAYSSDSVEEFSFYENGAWLSPQSTARFWNWRIKNWSDSCENFQEISEGWGIFSSFYSRRWSVKFPQQNNETLCYCAVLSHQLLQNCYGRRLECVFLQFLRSVLFSKGRCVKWNALFKRSKETAMHLARTFRDATRSIDANAQNFICYATKKSPDKYPDFQKKYVLLTLKVKLSETNPPFHLVSLIN